MLDACIAELLRDENVPEPEVARTLKQIIKTLRKIEDHGYQQLSVVENISAVLQHSAAGATACVGPKLFTGNSTRRVSAIVTHETLTRFILNVDLLLSLHGAREFDDADEIGVMLGSLA